MPDEDDIALTEKRLYGDKREETHAYVASGLGVTRVETAGGQIGRFSLLERCSARDIAGADGEIAVATDEDVLVLTDEGFAGTDFGPATAVGYGDGLLAAAPDGTVARYDDGWTAVGTVEEVRAIDGDLLAAAGGVSRITADGLDGVGLSAVRDVAPEYAATDDGLYRLAGEEWERVREGPHHAVAAEGDRVHAATGDGLVELAAGRWRACSLPVSERVVDVTYGTDACAVTEGGTVLVAAEAGATADGRGGWRSRSLGVPDVVGIAVA